MKYDSDLARLIDHTALKADTSSTQIAQLCEEAQAYHFAAVCVPSYYVPMAVAALKDSTVKVATVVGFPMGYCPTSAKLNETDWALTEGAQEIDMVVNIAALKEGKWAFLQEELRQLQAKVLEQQADLKVIIETVLLDRKEIIKICELCGEIGVSFVKTSTGFAGGGATVADVALMRSVLPAEIQIKASGGIRNRKFALELVAAGANRLGCSGSLEVIKM